MSGKPRIAVHKFSSCDGCQLAILCLEDELLLLAEKVEIALFHEARSAVSPGPWDVSFVEGSITTPHEAARILEIREQSGLLVALGACATSGGIQALRNWADVDAFTRAVYASPEHIKTLATSTPISDFVKVDLELHGCPIDRFQLLAAVAALLKGRPPVVPNYALCVECKRAGHACVMVALDKPCLGPVTRAGCGALCPSFERGCYGCFGPAEGARPDVLADSLHVHRHTADELVRTLRGFTGWAEPFRTASDRLEGRR